MQQHGSKYIPAKGQSLPINPGGWSSKLIFFSEHCPVAYQIKWNYECSNMVANILPATPPAWPWGWVQQVKIQIFHNMVMLHIKSNRIVNAAACK